MAPLPRRDGLKVGYSLLEKTTSPDAAAPKEDLVREAGRLTNQSTPLMLADWNSQSLPVVASFDTVGTVSACFSEQNLRTSSPSPALSRILNPENIDGESTIDVQQYSLPTRRWFMTLDPKLQGPFLSTVYGQLDEELRDLTKSAGDLVKAGKYRDAIAILSDELQQWDRSHHFENSLFTLRARRILAEALYKDAMANRRQDPILQKVIKARDLLHRNMSLFRNAEGLREVQTIPTSDLLEKCERALALISISPSLTTKPTDYMDPLRERLLLRDFEGHALSPTAVMPTTAGQYAHQFRPRSNSTRIATVAATTADEQHELNVSMGCNSEAETLASRSYQHNSRPIETQNATKPPVELNATIEGRPKGKVSTPEETSPEEDSNTRIGHHHGLAIRLTLGSKPGG